MTCQFCANTSTTAYITEKQSEVWKYGGKVEICPHCEHRIVNAIIHHSNLTLEELLSWTADIDDKMRKAGWTKI